MSRVPGVPDGITEIRQLFGDVRHYVRDDGTLDVSRWERHQLGFAILPTTLALSWDTDPLKPGHQVTLVRRVRCHVALVDVVEETFRDLYDEGLWPELHCLGGFFEPRRISGSAKLSLHTWGAAFDLCPERNARGVEIEQTHFGGTPAGARVRDVIGRHGWIWGGHFPTPDAMHWQWARGY